MTQRNVGGLKAEVGRIRCGRSTYVYRGARNPEELAKKGGSSKRAQPVARGAPPPVRFWSKLYPVPRPPPREPDSLRASFGGGCA